MKRSNHVLCALLLGTLLGGGLSARGAGAQTLGLMDAYQAALKSDPSFRSAYFTEQAGQENRILGRSNLLPTVSASYSGGKNHSDITTALRKIPQDYVSRTESLQIRQTLFNFDAWSRYKQGGLQADYASTVYLGEQQQVVLRLVNAYVEVLFKQDQLALAKIERDTYLERMKVNDRMFAKGEGTRTDMLETKARLDVAEADLLSAQDNLGSTRASLASLIGMDFEALAPLTPKFIGAAADLPRFDDWKRLVLERNPDLRAKLLGVELSQQEVNKSRAGHMPRLDVVASYTRSTSDSINTIDQDSTTRSIGFQLNIPLYSGGAVSASTRQAVANREKAKADAQVEQDKQMLELRKDYDQLSSSVARIEALQKAVESGELLVTATEQSIKGGVRINLDLLDAQRQLSTTRRDLAQARYTYILAQLKLRAAAGTLSADDVREVAANFH